MVLGSFLRSWVPEFRFLCTFVVSPFFPHERWCGERRFCWRGWCIRLAMITFCVPDMNRTRSCPGAVGHLEG